MTTQSTKEAMTLLKRTRRRYIEQARKIAREQIDILGSTHTRAVLTTMIERGLVSPDIRDFWLGAVFRHEDFAPTGETFTYSESRRLNDGRKRNIHERTIKVWELA